MDQIKGPAEYGGLADTRAIQLQSARLIGRQLQLLTRKLNRMNSKFTGVWPAMLTPLDVDGDPSDAETEKLVELFIRQGLDGLYVLGSTGQGPLLSLAQRKRVAERVVKTASGRIPVMIHVGANSTGDAVELAKHAAAVGADAISSVGPIYYRIPTEAVFQHYRQIGSAAELPFFVYHLSSVNTLSLSGREYVARLLEIPRIAGMKFTDHDLYQLGLICGYAGDRLRIFSGADELICQAAMTGASGAIGTFFNIWGVAAQSARKGLLNGNIAAAQKFMTVFQMAVDEVLRSQSMWRFIQQAMQIRHGNSIGRCRPPLATGERDWDNAEVERIVKQVEEAAPPPR